MDKILVNYEDLLNTYKSKPAGLLASQKYQDWFPIKKSSVLAGIIADLMGDGHLQGKPKLRLDYTSNSKEELERFNSKIYQLFNIQGKIRSCTTNNYGTMNLGINNAILTRTLILLGVPSGAKVNKNFSIPNWILTNKNYFSRFVNRLFSCEASIDVKYKCIDFKMHKNKDIAKEGKIFFEQIRFYLQKHFNITSTNVFLSGENKKANGETSVGLRFKIKNKQSLINFYKYIKFDEKEKQNKLKLIGSTLLQPFLHQS